MKLLVYHDTYGCETGCCGHSVAWFPDDFVPADKWDYYDMADKRKFDFSHPGDDLLQFAKDLVTQEYGAEHVKDLDWEHCFVTDNC